MSDKINYFKVIAPLAFTAFSYLPVRAMSSNLGNLNPISQTGIPSDTIHKKAVVKGVRVNVENNGKGNNKEKKPGYRKVFFGKDVKKDSIHPNIEYRNTINIYISGGQKGGVVSPGKIDTSKNSVSKRNELEQKVDTSKYILPPKWNRNSLRKGPSFGIYSTYNTNDETVAGIFAGVPVDHLKGWNLEMGVGTGAFQNQNKTNIVTTNGALESLGNNNYTQSIKNLMEKSTLTKIVDSYLEVQKFFGGHFNASAGAFASYDSYDNSTFEYGEDKILHKNPDVSLIDVQKKDWNKGQVGKKSGNSISYGPKMGIEYNPSRNIGFSINSRYDISTNKFIGNAGLSIYLKSPRKNMRTHISRNISRRNGQ